MVIIKYLALKEINFMINVLIMNQIKIIFMKVFILKYNIFIVKMVNNYYYYIIRVIINQ